MLSQIPSFWKNPSLKLMLATKRWR
uniref:Uncharacterized protein n=1 Tax=Arundo donax TaxID=35708 RepID=A0A0A9C1K1_ARUDO